MGALYNHCIKESGWAQRSQANSDFHFESIASLSVMKSLEKVRNGMEGYRRLLAERR